MRWFFKTRPASAVKPSCRSDVRHTFATLALETGIPAKVFSEILGHANISITLDTYSHVNPSLQEDAVARVAAFVRGVGQNLGRTPGV